MKPPVSGVSEPYGVDMSGATHQLVLQFPASAFSTFDELVQYEDALIDTLDHNHEVDGHDIGSGEVNFFILTEDPESAWTVIRHAGGGTLLLHHGLQAAARRLDGEVYERFWPVDDERDFHIA